MQKLRKILIVLLGLVMAAGTAVSIAQASDMAVKMAITADLDGSGHSDCTGCPGGDGDNALQCVPVCAVAGFALLPAVSIENSRPVVELSLPVHPVARSRLSSPDPYPPKPRDL